MEISTKAFLLRFILVGGLGWGAIVPTFADNQAILAQSTAWTDDGNQENGWTIFDGLIAQMAINDDAEMGGDRVLLLPESFATNELPVTFSTDLMLVDYQPAAGLEPRNGIWLGFVLGLDENDPAPRNGAAVILERADSEGIFGGLRIHAGGQASEFAQFGLQRHHPGDNENTYTTLETFRWMHLRAELKETESGDLRIAAKVKSLVHNDMEAETSLTIERSALSGNRIALATSAQYGHPGIAGGNPLAYWDGLALNAPENPHERRFPSEAMMQAYLEPVLARMVEWPEFTWDHWSAFVFMREVNRRLYMIKHALPLYPTSTTEVAHDLEPYLTIAPQAAYRAHTVLGGGIYVREVVEAAILDAGQTPNEETVESWIEESQVISGMLQKRHWQEGPRGHEFVRDVREFLQRIGPDDERELPIKVMLVHALYFQDENGEEYWELSDELMQRLPEGDWRDRVMYDRILRLHKDGRLDEATLESRSWLFEAPDTPYSSRLVDVILSCMYKSKDYATGEELVAEFLATYGESSAEGYHALHYRAVFLERQGGDLEMAMDLFMRVAKASPMLDIAELQANSIRWARRLHDLHGIGSREEIVQVLHTLPASAGKMDLIQQEETRAYHIRLKNERLGGQNP